ncbi:MAG TPA: response regulator [Candidatus Angelobacter sp.]|nr:response regulator [Candidatus Angelobacter sp.]
MATYSSAREQGRTLRFLLVEDNSVDACLVLGLLKNHPQYGECRHVATLERGLAELSGSEIDVVLLDLNLSDSSGYSTFDRVRRAAGSAAILVLSGSDDEELAGRTVREGAQDYLVKGSFDGKLLHRAIRYAVERKASEEALRKSEATARAIFENALDAIVIFDDDGTFLEANEAAALLFGTSRAELIGKRLRDLCSDEFETERGRTRLFPVGRGKFTLRCADGKERIVDYCFSSDILPGRHLGVMRDITEQQKLEDQLRQSQKMEAVGRLAGSVAHDFNNILGVINGYAELIELHAHDDILRSKAARILSATTKASSLTKQLLAFGRKQVVAPVLLNLADVISDLSSMISCLVGADTQIVMLTRKTSGLVFADQGQMEQVLLNLVTNAHEAMPAGGTLTITLDRIDSQSVAAEIPPGDYVRLSVQDTGAGVDPEIQSRIFDPFFTTKPTGSGLGLSTVFGIVKQVGGYVSVDSQAEQGSVFSVYLPLAAEAVASQVSAPQTEQPSLSGEETILLVDDEEELSNAAAEYLRQCGYNVLKARAANEAIEVSRSFNDRIALLVTDIVLPGGSGRGLVDHIQKERPEIGVLLISGYADDMVRENGFGETTSFLQKPFSLQSLGVKIRTILDETWPRVSR